MIELGSSDAAPIMGVSPFKSPRRLWAEKLNLIEEDKTESEIMTWGKRLESAVLHGFAADHRLAVLKEQDTRHYESSCDPFILRATPDGVLVPYDRNDFDSDIILVECKCITGQPPPVPRIEWVIQSLHQRLVYEGVGETIAAQYIVAFGGLRTESWLIPRHPAAMDNVLLAEERFAQMVEREEPPPLMAEDTHWLGRRWPWSRPETVTLTDEASLNAISIYAQASQEVTHMERARDAAQAVLKASMGEAERALVNGTEITWKSNKNGVRHFRLRRRDE